MKTKGDFLAVILSDYKDCYVFLHNTKEKEIAETILAEGFIFENQLPHSTDRVNPGEPIEITYFLFQRKDYGIYSIIIAIPKSIYELYLEYSIIYEIGLEEILTITKPRISDNDEMIYTISPKHILGYFNTHTGEFVKNLVYDPAFNIWLNMPEKGEIYSR
jgi:hypothetical protein